MPTRQPGTYAGQANVASRAKTLDPKTLAPKALRPQGPKALHPKTLEHKTLGPKRPSLRPASAAGLFSRDGAASRGPSGAVIIINRKSYYYYY